MTRVDQYVQEPVERERLVTIREAAQTLGISIRALYRLIASGELPAPLKVGRASRIAMTELHAYIERLKAERDTVARLSGVRGVLPNRRGQ